MAEVKRISTDRQVSGLKAGPKPQEHTIENARGLVLRVSKAGTKAWEFRYTPANGLRKRLPLGSYPGLSLADARAKANALGVAVVGGADPAAERTASRKEARATGNTLRDLAEEYWGACTTGLHGGRGRPKRASTIATEKAWWKHIDGELGDHRFKEIGRSDVRTFMHKLAGGPLKPASVASVGAVLSHILAYAVYMDRLDSNPALRLARPLAWTSRDRLFDEKALTVLGKALTAASVVRAEGDKPAEDRKARLSPTTALALRFLILTMTRRTEVAQARLSEFDFKQKIWTIPPERTKAKRVHVVPLTTQILAVIEEAKALPGAGGEFLFPAPASKGAIDPHALTRAVSRLCARFKLPAGSPHDWRRSASTTLVSERFGFRRFIVGQLLGHKTQDGVATTAVYDRYDYLPEKRAALAAWCDYVAGLVEDREYLGTNVVQLARR
jgi:YD repeat-containing protein